MRDSLATHAHQDIITESHMQKAEVDERLATFFSGR